MASSLLSLLIFPAASPAHRLPHYWISHGSTSSIAHYSTSTNDLAVLNDGTCASVMDDGHIHIWKHVAQGQDVFQQGNEPGGVDSVVALN